MTIATRTRGGKPAIDSQRSIGGALVYWRQKRSRNNRLLLGLPVLDILVAETVLNGSNQSTFVDSMLIDVLVAILNVSALFPFTSLSSSSGSFR